MANEWVGLFWFADIDFDVSGVATETHFDKPTTPQDQDSEDVRRVNSIGEDLHVGKDQVYDDNDEAQDGR